MNRPLIIITLVALAGCEPPPPTEEVCFETDLLPLVGADCAICHENGEHGVRLRGEPRDFDTLQGYVEAGGPSGSALSDIVAGAGAHPPIWPADRPEHATLEAWIEEGARRECPE